MNKNDLVNLVDSIDTIRDNLNEFKNLNDIINMNHKNTMEILNDFSKILENNYTIQSNSDDQLMKIKKLKTLIEESLDEKYNKIIEDQFNEIKSCIDNSINKLYEIYKKLFIEGLTLLNKKNKEYISSTKDEFNNIVISQDTLNEINTNSSEISTYLSRLEGILKKNKVRDADIDRIDRIYNRIEDLEKLLNAVIKKLS